MSFARAARETTLGGQRRPRSRSRGRRTSSSSQSIAARVKARKTGNLERKNCPCPRREAPPPPPPTSGPSSSFLDALGLDFEDTDSAKSVAAAPPVPGIAPYISHGFRLALKKATKCTVVEEARASAATTPPLVRDCTQHSEILANSDCHGTLEDITTYRVIDYAPTAFHFIRRLSGIVSTKYIHSLSQVSGGGEGAGKSGQFFFHTHDNQYVLKTIKNSELPILLKILPSYAAFLASHPCSLLPRFFGLSSFALPKKHGGTIILVVMENILRPKPLGKSGWFTRAARHQRIHEVYDLKGSTKGRVTVLDKAEFKLDGGGNAATKLSLEAVAVSNGTGGANVSKFTKGLPSKKTGPVVLKDLNCQRRLRMSPLRRARFFKQLRADVEYLISWNLMDYSLLMGVSFNGGSGAYQKASAVSRTGRATSIVTARSRIPEYAGIGGDGNGNNASDSVATMTTSSGVINGSPLTGNKSALLSAVVNRIYTTDRSADFLPPGAAYTLSPKTVGRSCVRERDKAPYIVYHIEVTRLPQSGGRHRKSESWIIYRRYSDFIKLRRQLNLELASAGYTVPTLPPKVWLGNFDGDVLDKRQRALDIWMAQILGAFVRVAGDESTTTLRTMTSGAGSLASQGLRRFLTDDANEPPLGMRAGRDDIGMTTAEATSILAKGTASQNAKGKKVNMRVSRAEDMESGERVTLHLGIIDILQVFTMTKQIESSLKGALSHPDAISSTNAQKYGERFIKYLATVLP